MSHFCDAQLLAGSTVFTCKLLHFHKGQHRDFGPGWYIAWYPNAEGVQRDPDQEAPPPAPGPPDQA